MRVQEILTVEYHKRYVVVDEQGHLVVPVARYLKFLERIGRARDTLRAYAHGLKLFLNTSLSTGLITNT